MRERRACGGGQRIQEEDGVPFGKEECDFTDCYYFQAGDYLGDDLT